MSLWVLSLDNRFKFQPDVFNGFPDVLMMSVNLNHFTALNIKDVDYCWIANGIGKREVVNLQQSTDMREKCYNVLKNFFTTCKLGKDVITLVDIEIEKLQIEKLQKGLQPKNPKFNI